MCTGHAPRRLPMPGRAPAGEVPTRAQLTQLSQEYQSLIVAGRQAGPGCRRVLVWEPTRICSWQLGTPECGHAGIRMLRPALPCWCGAGSQQGQVARRAQHCKQCCAQLLHRYCFPVVWQRGKPLLPRPCYACLDVASCLCQSVSCIKVGYSRDVHAGWLPLVQQEGGGKTDAQCSANNFACRRAGAGRGAGAGARAASCRPLHAAKGTCTQPVRWPRTHRGDT